MKTPKKSGQPWSGADEDKLRKLADGNTPTNLIAYKLERSPDAVRSKAQELKQSLQPPNKSPYNRRKKHT